MTDAPSVLLIGIDGGTFDLIDPWLRAGELPAIAELLDGGSRAQLRSTHPPLTPVAWSSMLTGCNPGKHGAFAFMRIARDYAPQFLSGGSLPLPTVFEQLSRAGLRVGALNIPWTWPPRPLNGWCLSGLDAPSFGPGIAHPAGLYEELVAEFGGYFVKSVTPTPDGFPLDRMEERIAKIGAMARHLARTRPVDLLALCFVSTDQVQHWYFRTRTATARDGRRVEDLLLHTWRLVDREIGRLVEEFAGQDTTVMIASDHGAGPTEGGINLGRWLGAQGLLHGRSPGLVGGLRAGALRAAARLLPGAVRERLRGRLAGTRRRMISRLLVNSIDWPRTQAFCWSDYGSISLNLAGRFDAGCVSERQREALVKELAEGLLALRDPETGERVMSAPLRAEDIYHGPHVGDAPDLLAVPRGYRREILTDFTLSGPLARDRSRGVFAPAVREGTHRLHGMLCLSGNRARSGFVGSCARIEDITPTLLHLLGQPVPSYMDGRVLAEMLTGVAPVTRETVDLPGGASAATYSAAEAEAIERDLRGLGYL